MTSDTAIRVDHYILSRVEGLSKLYRIGRAQQRHDTLRDALTAVFRRQASGIRHQASGVRRQASGIRDQETGDGRH